MYRLNSFWRQRNTWFRDSNQRVEWLWLMGLLLAAVLVFSINLGRLPLCDWDEGTVAQVAREFWRTPFGQHWLYPTLVGGVPYFNKPPLMHWLIALVYKVGGVNEWTSRLPGALLSAASVPLLYAIGRELFPQRLSAIFSALIYLTTMPVVRHNRMAMLDGATVTFLLLLLWCLLRLRNAVPRRHWLYSLGIGLGFALMCLTKGLLGILLAAIAVLFLAWDKPQKLTSKSLWLGLLLGSIPVTLWFGAQWLHYGNNFLRQALMAQSFRRIWATVEDNTGPPWYYVEQIFLLAWPWLLFVPQGLAKAWQNRHLSWAKLVLVWSIMYLLTISTMQTKLPWYVLPIYPSLALAGGNFLAEVWHWPRKRPYPRPWVIILALLAVVVWAGSVYFSPWLGGAKDGGIQLILTVAAGTITIAAVLVARRNRQFLSVLFAGMYVTLLLFMSSAHWLWDLLEFYPVQPVVAIIEQHTPSGQRLYTSFPENRPSLDFYSNRQILPATASELQHYWQHDPQPYLLLDQATLEKLQLEPIKLLGTAEGWSVITRKSLVISQHYR